MRILSAKIIPYGSKKLLGLEVPISQMHEWLERYDGKFPNEFDVKMHRNKRSKDANAYMWQLADKIAIEIGITKEEVYRSHIKEVGVFTDVQIMASALQSLKQGWKHNGIGWFADTIQIIPNQVVENMAIVRLYYGSSTYDTKQMARLIDNMVQEAKQLNIETLTPDELERMVKQWNVSTK